jgi:NADH dehydrogenase
MKTNKRIVITGGGFAGLHFARELSNRDFKITLIDKFNHHQFQPLFYQVASARLEPSSISFPFRKIFQKSTNVEFRLAEVEKINSETNEVITSEGVIHYDYLIVATGCKTNYFGNENLQKYAWPMKTTLEAIEIRNRLLLNFEHMLSNEEDDREGFLNILIVGAGPTGVEMAGALAELRMNILPKDYPHVDFSKLRIIVVSGSKFTLPSMSEVAQKASRSYLLELGVELITETFITDYNGTLAVLNNGQTIKTMNVIWAAGVTGNLLDGINPSSVTNNRYIVDRYNKIEGYNNVYAIGDICLMKTPNYPTGHPQLANVAINQGKNLATNFLNMVRNKPLEEFEYRDLGSMATIGKHKAVVDLPFFKFKGYFAWFIWMFLHLMLILSVKNRLIIFVNWAWSYFTKDSSLRLILKSKK